VEVGSFHTRLFVNVYVTCGDFHDESEKGKRVCITFYANLGKSATENLTIIQQDFGDQILSRTQVFQWHAWFKTGRTSVDDEEHTGRPTSCTTRETVAQIQKLARQDGRRKIHDIAEEVELIMGHANRF
jgi:hypothetical protein